MSMTLRVVGEEVSTYEGVDSWEVTDAGMLIISKFRHLTDDEKRELNKRAMRRPGGLAENGAPDAVEVPVAAWAPGAWFTVDVVGDSAE